MYTLQWQWQWQWNIVDKNVNRIEQRRPKKCFFLLLNSQRSMETNFNKRQPAAKTNQWRHYFIGRGLRLLLLLIYQLNCVTVITFPRTRTQFKSTHLQFDYFIGIFSFVASYWTIFNEFMTAWVLRWQSVHVRTQKHMLLSQRYRHSLTFRLK